MKWISAGDIWQRLETISVVTVGWVMLLEPRGQRSGMLPNTPQCAGQLSTSKNHQLQVSTVPRLRNPALDSSDLTQAILRNCQTDFKIGCTIL